MAGLSVTHSKTQHSKWQSGLKMIIFQARHWLTQFSQGREAQKTGQRQKPPLESLHHPQRTATHCSLTWTAFALNLHLFLTLSCLLMAWPCICVQKTANVICSNNAGYWQGIWARSVMSLNSLGIYLTFWPKRTYLLNTTLLNSSVVCW